MRRSALPLLACTLSLACGGDDEPREAGAPRPTTTAEKRVNPEEVTREQVERAAVEATGAVALVCKRDPARERVWNCRQGDTQLGATATVNDDGTITVE